MAPDELALASDPTYGPMIGVLSGAGNLEALVKEGSLRAAWTDESNSAAGLSLAG